MESPGDIFTANPWFSHIYKVHFSIVRGSGYFGKALFSPPQHSLLLHQITKVKHEVKASFFFFFNILFIQYSLILFSPSITPLRSYPPPTHSTLPLSKPKQPPQMKQSKIKMPKQNKVLKTHKKKPKQQ